MTIKRKGFPDVTEAELKPLKDLDIKLDNNWEKICSNKSWDSITDRTSYKPRIVYLIESFEKQYPDTDSREQTACLAVATYLFGPIDDEEEMELYLGIVKRRLRDYRNQPIQ